MRWRIPFTVTGVLDSIPDSTQWYNQLVADEYSHCRLSFGHDKLAAISALASAWHRHRPCAYHAGIWQESLILGLRWERDGDGAKTSCYRAPSWSWASQDSAVKFHHMTDIEEDGAQCCSVLHVSTIPATSDPFGMVAGGQLVLEARGLSVNVDPSEEEFDEGHVSLISRTGKVRLPQWRTQMDDSSANEMDVTAVFVYQNQYGVSFMLVRPLDREIGLYVRVGVGLEDVTPSGDSTWDEHGARQRFTIL